MIAAAPRPQGKLAAALIIRGKLSAAPRSRCLEAVRWGDWMEEVCFRGVGAVLFLSLFSARDAGEGGAKQRGEGSSGGRGQGVKGRARRVGLAASVSW